MIKIIVGSLLCVVLLASLSGAYFENQKISEIGYKQYAVSEVSSVPQSGKKQNIQQQDKYRTQSSQQANSESENQTEKYIIIISLLLISVVSLILHFRGQLILYKDYTDAAVTIGSVLCSFVIWFLCKNLFDLSMAASLTMTLLVFCVIFIFVLRTTYVTNKNLIFTVMSLLTKYTTTFLYAILVIGLTASNRSPQKEGESLDDFELRRKKEEAQDVLWKAFITALFIWFIHATTKLKEWSPIGNYFSLSFKKIDLNEPTNDCQWTQIKSVTNTYNIPQQEDVSNPASHDQDLRDIHKKISYGPTTNEHGLFKPGDRVKIKDSLKAELLAIHFDKHDLRLGVGPKHIDLIYVVDVAPEGYDLSAYPEDGTIEDAIYINPNILEKC